MDIQRLQLDTRVNLIGAAIVLGVHPSTIHRLLQQGRITGTKWHGTWLFERSYLENYRANYSPLGGRKTFPTEVLS